MSAKTKTVWFCSNCGNEYSKWMGKCPSCGQWNTMVEKETVTGKRPVVATSTGSGKPMPLTDVSSTGENATAIRVNGQDIPYSLTLLRIFQEYEIATIDLVEGENIIEFVVDNDNTVMGGTYRAVGFMTDYIRLADCGATLTWSPIYDNLESN